MVKGVEESFPFTDETPYHWDTIIIRAGIRDHECLRQG